MKAMIIGVFGIFLFFFGMHVRSDNAKTVYKVLRVPVEVVKKVKVPYTVIRYVPKEVIKTVPVEKIVYRNRIIEKPIIKYVDRPVVRYVPKEVIRTITVPPRIVRVAQPPRIIYRDRIQVRYVERPVYVVKTKETTKVVKTKETIKYVPSRRSRKPYKPVFMGD